MAPTWLCPRVVVLFAPLLICLHAAGGLGRVLVRTGTPGCHWRAASRDSWISVVGVSDWYGDLEAHFNVAPNTTGVARVGTVVIGEKPWEVRQSAQ